MTKSKNIMPPLNALKAFDAVARLGSMNKAARVLGIAPSSVTQHIRNLEDYIGTDLFDRQANAIALNERGRAYAEQVQTAFDTIQSATGQIATDIENDPVRISCVPTLGGAWLAEQLAAVKADFPGVAIRCDFSPTLVDFEVDEIDLAIRYGSGEYPGAISDCIHVDQVAPICTPETARHLITPRDLLNVTRLDSAESAPDGRSLWAYWAAEALGGDIAAQMGNPAQWALQSSQFSIEVLRATPTVAILEHSIIRKHIEAGVLVAPLELWVPAPFGYHIVASKRRPLRPAAKRLKALLKRSAPQHFGSLR
ncbi:MAG: LysR substrate-binding domain-containing protein [Roseobacter sp.]